MYQLLDIEEIHVDPEENYRTQINQETLPGLYKSFVAVHELTGGERWMLNPVDVVKLEKPIDGKKYRLRFGFRRYFAAKYGLEKAPTKNVYMEKIPANVVSDTNDESASAEIIMALVENLQREDVPALDEAQALQKALQVTGDTMTALAKRVGKSKAWVSQRVALLDLPPEIQGALHVGELTVGHARQLGRLGQEEQLAAFELQRENDWEVQELEKHVKSMLKGETPPVPPEKEKAPPKNTLPKEKDAKAPTTPLVFREVETLVEKVKVLAEKVESASEMQVAASKRVKARLVREEAYYAGAQAGIAWVMGQQEDIAYDTSIGETVTAPYGIPDDDDDDAEGWY